MFLSFKKSQRIKNDKDFHYISLSLTFIVLFLFIIHLILIPLTFTPLWHCPMMESATASSSTMNMDVPCTHMQFDKKQKNNTLHKNQMHHGIFICPLCNGLTLPNPLLGYIPILPNPVIILTFFKYKIYQSQAPPVLPIKITLPRAPPLL